MILYHGTVEIHRKNIRENGIILEEGTLLCDFGQGFYTTDDYNFALKTARNRSYELSGFYKKSELKPVVIIMSFDYEAAIKNLNVQTFEQNNFWLEFVANNRSRNKNMISNNHNKDNKYDIVIGPTADKKIHDMRKIFKEDVSDNFYLNFINNNYKTQYSFHTKNSLNYLKIIKI